MIYGTPIYESVHGDTAIAMAETAFEKVEKTYIGSEPALYGEGMKSIDHEDEYQYFLNFSTDSHYVLLGLMTIGPEEAAKKEFERFKETIVFD